MTWVARLLLIVAASLLASFAAGAVLVAAVLLPEWSDLPLEASPGGRLATVVTFGAIFLSGFALLPALVLIALGESLSIRSLLFYALGGALIAALLYFRLRGWDTLPLRVNGFARRELEIMAASGIVAGFTYWAIAGRRAGAWRSASASDHSELGAGRIS